MQDIFLYFVSVEGMKGVVQDIFLYFVSVEGLGGVLYSGILFIAIILYTVYHTILYPLHFFNHK